ncbi:MULTISPECIES: glycosyltransferase [unclassified Agromyces]|uniref:glycosyltransferase n=1 Tax=unclassified Agromyces TaxID=2639701 RepID=UPI003014A402
MPEIVLAHDYLVQCGGAERVVAHWASAFGARTLYTLAYSPEGTFAEFRDLEVRPSIRGSLTAQVERLLPALPSIAARTSVTGGDVALVSSSGWAHRFAYEIPHVVYVHSPARWLYAASDYRMRLSPLRRAGLWASTPLLRHGDREAMRRAHSVIANSVVTRDRIREAYGLDAEVVNPPVEPVSAEARAPRHPLPDAFTLCVARDRGYKNIALAVSASRAAGLPIVLAGSGSEHLDRPGEGVHGLGRVTDAELAWLYRRAEVVIGSGREDFGLTIVEAALEGTPAAVVPAGGYLETVSPGVNGFHAASATADGLAAAILAARELDPAWSRDWARRFSLAAHIDKIEGVLEDVAQRA